MVAFPMVMRHVIFMATLPPRLSGWIGLPLWHTDAAAGGERPYHQGVVGSNPAGRTKSLKITAMHAFFVLSGDSLAIATSPVIQSEVLASFGTSKAYLTPTQIPIGAPGERNCSVTEAPAVLNVLLGPVKTFAPSTPAF